MGAWGNSKSDSHNCHRCSSITSLKMTQPREEPPQLRDENLHKDTFYTEIIPSQCAKCGGHVSVAVGGGPPDIDMTPGEDHTISSPFPSSSSDVSFDTVRDAERGNPAQSVRSLAYGDGMPLTAETLASHNIETASDRLLASIEAPRYVRRHLIEESIIKKQSAKSIRGSSISSWTDAGADYIAPSSVTGDDDLVAIGFWSDYERPVELDDDILDDWVCVHKDDLGDDDGPH